MEHSKYDSTSTFSAGLKSKKSIKSSISEYFDDGDLLLLILQKTCRLAQLVFIVCKPYLWLYFSEGERNDVSNNRGTHYD